MCDTWSKLAEECLYNAPSWLEWFTTWRRELLWVPGVAWGVISIIFIIHWATLNKTDHRKLGWMRYRNPPKKFDSDFQSWLYDYRFLVFVLSIILAAILIYVRSHYLKSPDALLNDLGAVHFWQLSPAGVSLFLRRASQLLGISFLFQIALLAGLGIIWFDPYAFSKFYLTLTHNGTTGEITFKGEQWQLDEKEKIRGSAIFARVSDDTIEFQLERPLESKKDWILLRFDPDKKTLGADGTRSSKDGVWFANRDAPTLLAVGNGEVFCLGADKNRLSRFRFEL